MHFYAKNILLFGVKYFVKFRQKKMFMLFNTAMLSDFESIFSTVIHSLVDNLFFRFFYCNA